MQQHPPQPAFTASPSAIHHTTASPQSSPHPSSTPARRLPDRNANADSIEDAFAAFILYCNPGVPLETDSAALREAFRTPPKSGGKSFSTFTLFELIKKLETKELKTWAELALKLGVEPPDQEKGQSSQKIQQYAVRLKVCMHAPPHSYLGLVDESSAGCTPCMSMPFLSISSAASLRTGPRFPPNTPQSPSWNGMASPPRMTWPCAPSCLRLSRGGAGGNPTTTRRANHPPSAHLPSQTNTGPGLGQGDEPRWNRGPLSPMGEAASSSFPRSPTRRG